MLCLVTHLCPTLCNPMDCSPPGSPLSIRILQVRILEWVACPPPGDLPNPGIEPTSPVFQANSLPAEPHGGQNPSWLQRFINSVDLLKEHIFVSLMLCASLFLFHWFLLFIMSFFLFIFCLICFSFSNFLKRRLRLFIGDS